MKLILGGPGCGKTTRLIRIVEGHLKDGVKPDEIAFVSFTRKAAREAVERAAERFNLEWSDFPHFKTLHAVAYRGCGIARGQLLDRADYREISTLMGVRYRGFVDESEGLLAGDAEGDQLLHIIGISRATLTPLRDVWQQTHGEVDWFKLKQLDDILTQYKGDRDRVDFADMLSRFVRRGESLGVKVGIIDEAQDLSKAQWAVARTALKGAKRIYIAGDDDQAIHRWNGAAVDFFLSLEGDREVLPLSHRLPKAVYTYANGISSQIGKRFDKDWDPADHAGSVERVTSLDTLPIDNGEDWMLLARNSLFLSDYRELAVEKGVAYATARGHSVRESHALAISGWVKRQRDKELSDAEISALHEHTVKGASTRGAWFDGLKAISVNDREYYRSILRNGGSLIDPPKVYIGTVHSVKGGEATNVCLRPDITYKTLGGLESAPDDEHRVFYVGATRARRTLYLPYPTTRMSYPL